MDPRLYTYEYRRPRPNNPTYMSNNVNSSMTYYLNTPVTIQPGPMGQSGSQPSDSRPEYHLSTTPNSEQLGKNRSAVLENGSLKRRYEDNGGQQAAPQYERQRSLPKMGENQHPEGPVNAGSGHSNLSNYGSNLLNNDSRTFRGSLYNDQEIYKKQDKKFNIITLKPNEFEHTIKQYPKLTLQDKDAYYYKKMQQQTIFQEQQARLRQLQREMTSSQHYQQYPPPQQPYDKSSAGKPTFTPPANQPPYQHQPNAKILNNIDELGYI